ADAGALVDAALIKRDRTARRLVVAAQAFQVGQRAVDFALRHIARQVVAMRQDGPRLAAHAVLHDHLTGARMRVDGIDAVERFHGAVAADDGARLPGRLFVGYAVLRLQRRRRLAAGIVLGLLYAAQRLTGALGIRVVVGLGHDIRRRVAGVGFLGRVLDLAVVAFLVGLRVDAGRAHGGVFLTLGLVVRVGVAPALVLQRTLAQLVHAKERRAVHVFLGAIGHAQLGHRLPAPIRVDRTAIVGAAAQQLHVVLLVELHVAEAGHADGALRCRLLIQRRTRQLIAAHLGRVLRHD